MVADLLGDFKFVLQSHQPQGVEGINQRLTEAAPVVHLEASASLYIGSLRLADFAGSQNRMSVPYIR